ncbi:MAG: glycerophosphodiester phosphodiesterase family protein [Phycisphaerae bacterium]|nr:glycerophosphodiester phosphodiesterase family protein [Tepidisphaeraceae bacterium]
MKTAALILAVAFSMLVAAPLPAEDAAVPKRPTKLPELTAHRGESHDAPENTLAAVRLGWERGVDAVEIDVHLSKDGKLIVIHDADTERVAGQKLVVKQTDSDALRKLDAGSWGKWKESGKYAGEKLPLLEEVLATIPAGKRLFLEIKIGPEAVAPVAAALTAAGTPADRVCIIAFNIETIREARKVLPHIKAYWLTSQKKDESGKWLPTVEDLIKKAKSADASGLDIGAAKAPVDVAFVKSVKDAGLEMYVWTIDDPKLARKLADAGVDGITTNRAQWMREQFRGAGE